MLKLLPQCPFLYAILYYNFELWIYIFLFNINNEYNLYISISVRRIIFSIYPLNSSPVQFGQFRYISNVSL